MVTLGCARNEVDSEELAARLAAGGWTLRGEGEDADVVLVNTCGFIQAAKQESIDELLSAADSGAKVAAVGCLAERYGTELADELPEAQVLSFDDYTDIAARLRRRAGRAQAARLPRGAGPADAAAGEPGKPPGGPAGGRRGPCARRGPHRPAAGRRARLRAAGGPPQARRAA